jgi:tetratricopeptide (TPR) repeat protein
MWVQKVIAIAFMSGTLAFAGKFSCNWVGAKEEVYLNIPRPPDALIRARNLRVQWESSGGSFQRGDQLRNVIETALSKEFSFSDPNAEALMKLSLLSYEPVRSRTYNQTETRYVKVGEKTVYDKNGKARQEAVFDNRQVPVEYWEARGTVRIGVAIVDKAGTPIDSFAPEAAHNMKMEIAVGGSSTLGRRTLPSSESLETDMLNTIAHQIQRRYTATIDRVQVILACDDELKPGNKFAKGGQYAEAFNAWKAAKLKKNPGDQLFNLAVAKEALAYAEYSRSQNIEDMLPIFKEATDFYEQALRQDPEEKYMQRQVQRLTTAKNNIDNVLKQYQVQQEEARIAAEKAQEAIKEKLAAEARKNEMETAVKDTSPDSGEEARFRSIARVRLGAIKSEIGEAQERELIAFGQRTYGLNEIKSFRVVRQEIERKNGLAQKLKDYEDTLKPMIADGRLTSDERGQLKDLQKALGLDDSEIRGVESKYTFKEASQEAKAPVPPKPAAPTKAATKKPASPTKPPVVGAVPSVAPSQTAPPKPGIGTSGVKPKK